MPKSFNVGLTSAQLFSPKRSLNHFTAKKEENDFVDSSAHNELSLETSLDY